MFYKKNMKLYGVTSVHNEEILIPIVIPYLEKMGYDKLVIWDNNSTDRTVELLQQYEFIEMRHYSTEIFNEDEKLKHVVDTISEFTWLPHDQDEQVWVTMCDFDEVFQLNLPSHSLVTLKDYLFWCGEKGYSVIREHLWCLMENGERVHYGEPFYWNKPNMFRLDGIDRFVVSVGQHDLSCTYLNGTEPMVLYDTKMLSAFHLKFYNRFIYLSRQTYRAERDYSQSHDYYNANIRENLTEYDERLKFSVSFLDYMSNKLLNGKEYVGRFLI